MTIPDGSRRVCLSMYVSFGLGVALDLLFRLDQNRKTAFAVARCDPRQERRRVRTAASWRPSRSFSLSPRRWVRLWKPNPPALELT